MRQLPIKIPNTPTVNIPALPISRLITVLEENNNVISVLQETLDTIKNVNSNIIKTMKDGLPDVLTKTSSGTPNCKVCVYYLPLMYKEDGYCRCLCTNKVISTEACSKECKTFLKLSEHSQGKYTLQQVAELLNIKETDVGTICWLYDIGESPDNIWGSSQENINKVFKFYFNNRALTTIYYLNLWGEWRLHLLINKYNEKYKFIRKETTDTNVIIENKVELPDEKDIPPNKKAVSSKESKKGSESKKGRESKKENTAKITPLSETTKEKRLFERRDIKENVTKKNNVKIKGDKK